jgi:hypothetical protein
MVLSVCCLPPTGLLRAAALSTQAPAWSEELALKAQFLIELPNYISLAKAKKSAQPFFDIVILGDLPFRRELDAYAKERRINKLPIRIRYVQNIHEEQHCDLLFISASEAPRARALVAWCHAKGILAVAEGKEMADQGVMVNLLVEGPRLRVGLNQRVLQEEGFAISSQLLKVARILVPPKPGR